MNGRFPILHPRRAKSAKSTFTDSSTDTLKTAQGNLTKINGGKDAASADKITALRAVATTKKEIEKVDRNIYFAKANLIQREYEDNNVPRVLELADRLARLREIACFRAE